jgi:hypothetical protein
VTVAVTARRPFDLHNPKGMKDPTHPPFTSHKMPYMYSTPLRSLVSKDLTNLFFAGKSTIDR